MRGIKNQSALLAKHFNMYKKNSRSRVFAPLAESYRKLGMLEEAYKVLKDGIRLHPDYTLGYIVLAHCYYDENKFEATYNTLRPIINKNAENISLQKIFALSCIQLGHLEEALDTYKYLLFLNPKDKYFAEKVKLLEDDLLVGQKKFTLEQVIKAPQMPEISRPNSFDDEWVQVDFNAPPEQLSDNKNSEIEDWVMEKSPQIEQREEKFTPKSLEDDFYADEFESEGDIDEVNAQELITDIPIISHTLVDLYCKQNYFDKAIDLLEKFLELNPQDQATLRKLHEVKLLKASASGAPQEIPNLEGDGHQELLSIIENKVKMKSPKQLELEKVLGQFLDMVKERHQDQKNL